MEEEPRAQGNLNKDVDKIKNKYPLARHKLLSMMFCQCMTQLDENLIELQLGNDKGDGLKKKFEHAKGW